MFTCPFPRFFTPLRSVLNDITKRCRLFFHFTKSIYDNNPARLRSIAQYKYIIFNGVITDIKEERNLEFNYILEDYIEYKYYTIRLNGGVYFESIDANFVSNLSRGQQAYFVAQYTDKQSFNRPLFELKMYAGNKQGLISLLKNSDIRLNSLVAR